MAKKKTEDETPGATPSEAPQLPQEQPTVEGIANQLTAAIEARRSVDDPSSVHDALDRALAYVAKAVSQFNLAQGA